jgi:hypothetical protein
VDQHTAPDFDMTDEKMICGDEQDSVGQEGGEEAVDIMALLLTEGLPDDASRRFGVKVRNGALRMVVIDRKLRRLCNAYLYGTS